MSFPFNKYLKCLILYAILGIAVLFVFVNVKEWSRGSETIDGFNDEIVTVQKRNDQTNQRIERNNTKKERDLLKPKNIETGFGDDFRKNISLVFISVKTTGKNHNARLKVLLDTWWEQVRDEVYFFTDVDDPNIKTILKDRLINTNCTDTHSRDSLCCKTSVEFDYFIISKKRWFCHFDDDTYINLPVLFTTLSHYNYTEDWYLGKPSLSHPIEIQNIDDRTLPKISFWFATGGAGFCISRPLALKMIPFAGGGRLRSQCTKIRLPDDCAIGFIIDYHLKRPLTVIKEFHSHLEGLWMLKTDTLHKQITLSYGFNQRNSQWNRLSIVGFNETIDPTRFLTVHCLLNKDLEKCQKMFNRNT